ncbi:MAG: FG-GAP repeat protein [candidate division Zixibacteria bacterium]|nr:FG-GAP repeat protein [candidate division Zixibacteria bacterium]
MPNIKHGGWLTILFLTLLTASAAQSQYPPLYVFTGEAVDDMFGYSVSGAGDVNNDGFADLIVGAFQNDAGGNEAGRAYVYSGRTGGLLHTFTGEAVGDVFGGSVSGAGDVNNDGFADLIVGAFNNDAGGNSAGRAYVYSGQTGALLHTFTAEAADDWFGVSVSGAGDVNNDGFADLIVGAWTNDAGGSDAGRAYVYSGQTGTLLHTFTGEAASDVFGFSVSGAGDVNNDGFADLIVGAILNDAGGSDAGPGRMSTPTCAVTWPVTPTTTARSISPT